MASNYVCSLAVAVISLLVAVAFLSSLTCDGADCFAVQNLQITRFSRLHSHLKPAKPEQVESLYSGGPVLEQSEKVSDNSSEEDGSGIVDERAEQGDLEDIEVVSGESSVDAVEKASSKPVEGIRDDIVGQFSADAVEIASSKPVDAGEEASSDTVEVIRSETVGNDAAGGYVEDDQEASASSPDPVIFGTGFYPDGRFHPQTGFDPYAPTTPPLLPARKLTLNVMDFGAVGDGITLNTAAFEAAVAAASDTVGGALLLVPNGVWLTGCFNLTSHLTLFLESGAVLLASQDPSHWPVLPPLPSYGQGRDLAGPRYGSFIHGEHLTDVVITGKNGTIDGGGDPWWAAYKAGQLNHTRGCLVELQWSTRLVIFNLTLLDSPFWNIHLYDSHDVTVHGLTITAASHSKNTDGVDPDSCTDVLIEDCYISTGDDAIAIKSGMDAAGVAYGKPTRNVVVRNLVVGRTHGLSIGSEMSGGVANVLFQNIQSLGPGASGLRIKSAPGRGGYVTNITYRDIVLENQKYAISVYSNYRQDAATPPAETLPRLEGVLFQNVTGRQIVYAGRLHGLSEAPLRGIKLEGVYLENQKRYKCDYVYVEADHAEPPPCERGWDSQNRRGLLASWLWTRRTFGAILGMPGEGRPPS